MLFCAVGCPVTAADPGWPDTVYIIDLVAAGMQQRSSSDASSSSDGDSQGSSQAAEAAASSAASELVAGLAAVFEDPGCTLIVQDASQVRFMLCCMISCCCVLS
jgi:predicted RNA-binding Zn ribbon-like protein